MFRDDKYTETQTEGDLSQNGSRSETSASFIDCDASSGGCFSPSKPAAGKRHRKKMSNTQARANWRRAATKRR